MKTLMPVRRWTYCTLRSLALAAGIWGAGDALTAQTTPVAKTQPALPKKIYTKTTEFKLPVQMDEKTRATLDKVCLYVKTPTTEWVRQDTGPASLPHFLHRVSQDGEYWFALTTIDQAGKPVPADVSQEPPALRVVVDTKAPALEVQPWTSPTNDVCIRCIVTDANADPASLKAVAKMPGGDQALLPYPNHPGAFKTTGAEMAMATIVVTAADLSGNQATREVRLQEMTASSQPMSQKAPHPLPAELVTKVELPPRPELPLLPPPPMAKMPEVNPPVTPPAPPSNSVAPAAANVRPELDHLPRTTPNLAAKQVINTTRAAVDYRIDQVGPSGVGKVELYLTADQGQTWQRVGEDPDRRSPVEFELPGEGVFGVRLAITNGNGFGGSPPQRGDAPLATIEVDTSAPFVQLRPIEPITTNGQLEIRWQASDKNLGSEAVNLFYRSRTDGPWQVIARGLKNDGVYRWAFPRDVGPQFLVKIEVTDLSGNTARAETPNPIVLDMTEPRASVIGVSGLGVRSGN
jgi:hypothetical protein